MKRKTDAIKLQLGVQYGNHHWHIGEDVPLVEGPNSPLSVDSDPSATYFCACWQIKSTGWLLSRTLCPRSANQLVRCGSVRSQGSIDSSVVNVDDRDRHDGTSVSDEVNVLYGHHMSMEGRQFGSWSPSKVRLSKKGANRGRPFG